MADLRAAQASIHDAWLSAGDADGNAAAAGACFERGDLDASLEQLEWLRSSSSRAAHKAEHAIKEIMAIQATAPLGKL